MKEFANWYFDSGAWLMLAAFSSWIAWVSIGRRLYRFFAVFSACSALFAGAMLYWRWS